VGASSEPVSEREREQQQLHGQPAASTATNDGDGEPDGHQAGDGHGHREDGHCHRIRRRAVDSKISHQFGDVAAVLSAGVADIPDIANIPADVAADIADHLTDRELDQLNEYGKLFELYRAACSGGLRPRSSHELSRRQVIGLLQPP